MSDGDIMKKYDENDKSTRGRLLPSGHPDIQKAIDAARDKVRAKRENMKLVLPESSDGILNASIGGELFIEAKELSSGIFWVISDYRDLSDYKFLMFDIPSDSDGKHHGTHSIPLNAKSGGTYNHKKIWANEIQNNSSHKPYNKKPYNYYPRGRVEISRNQATIYLNPNINVEKIIRTIKLNFGLLKQNIGEVRVVADGGSHYKCWMDRAD